MMQIRDRWIRVAVLFVAASVAGCGSAQKEATEAALNAAELALSTVQGEAAKYVPDQLKSAQDSLQAAKDAVAKGDYGTALDNAQEATTKAKALVTASAAKKEAWSKTWASLSVSAPRSLDQIKARLDAYSRKGAKLPEGMDETTLEAARGQYDALKQTWGNATAAVQRGDLQEGFAKIASFQESLAKLQELLGIKA